MATRNRDQFRLDMRSSPVSRNRARMLSAFITRGAVLDPGGLKVFEFQRH
jgi:hypothetical protein